MDDAYCLLKTATRVFSARPPGNAGACGRAAAGAVAAKMSGDALFHRDAI